MLNNNSAENFKDFLDAIKPYLNYQTYDLSGQGVDALNFSTDEKIIGTWIDGKPLYQKTVDFGTLPNATTKNVSHNISDIDFIVKVDGIVFNKSTFDFFALLGDTNPGLSIVNRFSATKVNLTFATKDDRSGFKAYVTIQYTKTTDSAVATGEKIVGQWVDGKPIYEKVIYIDKFVVTTGTVVTTAHNISNLESVVSLDGVIKGDNNIFFPIKNSINLESATNFANCYISIWADETYIKTNSKYSRVQNQPCYVTIRYTKTTD